MSLCQLSRTTYKELKEKKIGEKWKWGKNSYKELKKRKKGEKREWRKKTWLRKNLKKKWRRECEEKTLSQSIKKIKSILNLSLCQLSRPTKNQKKKKRIGEK